MYACSSTLSATCSPHISSTVDLILLLKWLYSPCGPSPLFEFPDLLFTIGRTPWMSDQLIARPLPKLWTGMADNIAWGSLTYSKFTIRVKQLKVPPGGFVPWIFSVLKNSTTSAGFEAASLESWGGNVNPRIRRPLPVDLTTLLPFGQCYLWLSQVI
jgi:hypothetical protein